MPIQQQEILAIAKTLGVENHLTFHGKIPQRKDLFAAYRSADIFVMLSENQANGDVEGFGIAILEANFFGLPAIGAKGCGIEDAIQDGKNGFLVDGDAFEEILRALDECLLQRKYLQQNARDWAIAHDWSKLIDSLFLI
ncbi:MAG: glycosyltransferase family 4 protein [Saprospiraceae bacterium]|nr:glycosyltransferase family 4 protein [Saprospiraceae bacterium]